METIYIVILGLLFILAISDLIVGVSNDAVNFLVSAIGSKSAPYWLIMIVASVGIGLGATFSSGMMEVARKGIFNPEAFYFSDIMIIFIAVMITDILLLDLFNTLGLPTSTTVSIVFELLGAAVGIAIIKINRSDNGIESLSQYINSDKALAIIAGILLSVVVAFSVGLLVQYIARFFFTFKTKKTYKYFGAIWAGIAITAITYFILVKGSKHASFMSKDVKSWISMNKLIIIGGSFIIWTTIMQFVVWFTKANILKFVVLAGTFALAMAFAGNDLVNFIGVPLAGLSSFTDFSSSGAAADSYSMSALSKPVHTDTIYLLIAALIMILTLWMSKKARTVTETEISLSRQSKGQEKFGSTRFSRIIVREVMNLGKMLRFLVPVRVKNSTNNRFTKVENKENDKDAPAFDLVRASVNLTVASVLISFATSLKLPLSTTYVTFMVAMGTSLADGAWGRETAVYRVTGVISVIGGWFVTALVAFTVAFVLANLINLGGLFAIITILAVAVLIILRNRKLHKKREAQKVKSAEPILINEEDDIFEACNNKVSATLVATSRVYKKILIGLTQENRKELKEAKKQTQQLNIETKYLKDNIYQTLSKLKNASVETGHYYVQIIDYLREMAHCLNFIVKPSFEHIDNNHTGLLTEQSEELSKLNADIRYMYKDILRIIQNRNFIDIDSIFEKQQNILNYISTIRKKQIKRVKDEVSETRNSMLYFSILSETKTLLLFSINLLKAQRDFVIYHQNEYGKSMYCIS